MIESSLKSYLHSYQRFPSYRVAQLLVACFAVVVDFAVAAVVVVVAAVVAVG